MKEVKIGIVGLGNRSTAWIPSIHLVRNCRITALCDKVEALVNLRHRLAMDLNKDAPIARFTDYDTMLRDADIDAVAILVEPHNNVELACRALEAGKHVIAEVPLCYSIEDCWRIVTAVERSDRVFQLGEQVRFSAFVQAWKKMVRDGTLGKVLYVEGQYLHGMGPDRYYHDAATGARIHFREAKKRKSYKSRFWDMPHVFLYLPHELSPMLHVLDDRVVKVAGMATRPKSYRYEWFPHSDMEVALMHTEKDTVMRMMAGFTVATLGGSEHHHRLIGVNGWVEQPMNPEEKGKLWLADRFMADKADVKWAYKDYWDTPMEALQSGHYGLDYYPIAAFVESILEGKPSAMGVYTAAETAAPAIVAAQSIERGGVTLDVPDFRPGRKRKAGRYPSSTSGR